MKVPLHVRSSLWVSLLIIGAAIFSFASSEEQFKCPEQFGYYRDTLDCSKYYVCVFGDALHEKCTGGLHFSLELQTCDWPRNVECVKVESQPEEIIEFEVEDEIFSSSRRTSATANSDRPRPSQLKPQTMQQDPLSDKGSNKESQHDYSRNRADAPKDSHRGRPQTSAPPLRTAPPPTTTVPPPPPQVLPTLGGDKQTHSVPHRVSESSSEDPLYAGDEHGKVSSPLDNYDPQEPKFDEAAPPLVDSEGGIHIADGGHGLDAFGGLAHLPGLGDFSVFEKPVYNAANGGDQQDSDQDYQQRVKEPTLSTRPRSLEGYPTSNRNGQSKNSDVVIDFSNKKEAGFDYADKKGSSFGTPPPTIFDDNADHRDYGGFDIITPVRNKNQNGQVVVNHGGLERERPSDIASPVEVSVPLKSNTASKDQIPVQRKPKLISSPIVDLDNYQKFNFDSDRNTKANNLSLPEVQFDDHPSDFFQNPQSPPVVDNYDTYFQSNQNNRNPNFRGDLNKDNAGLTEDRKNNRELGFDAILNTNNGKSVDPDEQYPRNKPKESTFNVDYHEEVIHEPVRGNRPQTNFKPKEQLTRLNPDNIPHLDEENREGSYKALPPPTSGAKDNYSAKQNGADNFDGNSQSALLPPHQGHDHVNTRLTFPSQPLDQNFGTYTGNQRHGGKFDNSEVLESPSITDIQKESPDSPKHPNQPNQEPPYTEKKQKEEAQPKEAQPDQYDQPSYSDYESPKNQYSEDYFTHVSDTTTRSPIRTRPTRPRKSTTTTTTTTTTPAPIRIRTRRPISQVTRPPGKPYAAMTPASPPYRLPAEFPTPPPYSLAQKCDPRKCRLPDCRCGGTDIPEGMRVSETPQLVLLTFDDAVNDLNNDLYNELFNTGRANPNGCPILGTFYVSHEWTDYGQVQTLYSQGHEIASHSITHSYGEKFSKNQWLREVHGQREILHLYGGVRMEDIRGMRAPFLQIGGNKMFEMLYDTNFTYDSSMPVYENNPPFWPYTLDYALTHECMIFPCPTKSFPGLWEVGMVMWVDLRGGRCSMGDACSNPHDEEAVTKMLMKNFNRHYKSNRAPFGLFYHSAWFNTQHHRRGFMKFLDEILQKDDVWLVTNWQLIQWLRNPAPVPQVNDFEPFNCRRLNRPPPCPTPTVCNVWYQGGVRYMKTCQPCPVKYPWVGSTGYDTNSNNRG